jgi:hypothetical protein
MDPNPRAPSGRSVWGAHAPSRAHFGALAEMPPGVAVCGPTKPEKVHDREGAIASTRGAWAPQTGAASRHSKTRRNQ